MVGAGKASAAMAQTLEQYWEAPLSGVVVTRYGFEQPCKQIEILQAGHPVPDRNSVIASRRIMQCVEGLGADDLLIVLISGGGSALLTLPAGNITLQEKIAINRALLDSGAPIHKINTVRKHLSAIKGGQLALRAAPATVVTLVISDVAGDDPATIASGPTVADPTTRQQALDILQTYQIPVSETVRSHLEGDHAETPDTRHPLFKQCSTHVIASAATGLAAAAAVGRAEGYHVEVLGDAIEGEARTVAQQHARFARQYSAPTILLSGGELTVTHPGSGRGGPNSEYALALAESLNGTPGIHAIACDSDGIDGSGDSAGAIIDPTTLQRAAADGLQAERYLDHHDSYHYFSKLDGLVVTGPTYTNINDFRAILIEDRSV